MANEKHTVDGGREVTKVELSPILRDLLLSGRPVFVGEFRRGVAVEFAGKGGRLFHQSKCSVETDTGTITVNEFLPDNVDWTKWAAPFAKGVMVYCVLKGLEETSGVLAGQGKLYSL